MKHRLNAAAVIPVALLGLALAVNLGVGARGGIGRPVTSDAHYFLELARSLADGDGYRVRDGFWPDEPSMRRLPAWPMLVASLLRAAPAVSPAAVARTTALVLNALLAPILFLVALRVSRRLSVASVAGVLQMVHPTGLYLAGQALSEPLFLALAAGGVLLLLRPGRVRPVGYLVLGTACLVRANFVLWVVFAVMIGAVVRFRGADRSAMAWVRAAACAALFLVPPMLWCVRNYAASGHFPVLSTLRGQTFYGGNNAVVAELSAYWGWWVFPNEIPGEPTMYALSRTMSEYEVDVYYFGRGKQYVMSHLAGMPRLWFGKVVRAYVPVPWKGGMGSWAVGLFRLALYAAVLVTAVARRAHIRSEYGTILAAMLLTNVLTVLVFWGYSRFAFQVEPFLTLPAAWAVVSGVTLLKGGKRGVTGDGCEPADGEELTKAGFARDRSDQSSVISDQSSVISHQ